MCDSNGDPLCPSKIRYGLGPVPDSYFVDAANAMPDYDQETAVYAGDKHLIEIKCKKGSVIRFVRLREEPFTVFPSKNASLIQRRRIVYRSEKSQKCDFCLKMIF